MALSRNRYGQVSTIRAYFDIVQYAKAIGYVKNFWNNSNTPQIDPDSTPYDFNPAKVETYLADNTTDGWSGSSNHLGFNVEFKNYAIENRNFAQLLKAINYYGFFGHNIKTASDVFTNTSLNTYGVEWLYDPEPVSDQIFANPQTYTGIVGDRADVGNGYTIIGVDGWDNSDHRRFEAIKVYINSDDGFTHNVDAFNIGAISVGRYMDFPHSANLSMNINYDYGSGIKSKNSTSGRTITNINYYKPPDWGSYPRWTHISSLALQNSADETGWLNKYDMRTVSGNGRRSWDLTWSFLSKEDTFPKTSEGNMFAHNMESAKLDDATADAIHLAAFSDSIIGTMMTLTMGGQIPFLLQMSNTHQDFAFVRINQKSISIQQSAPNLYTCKLKLTEVW